MKKSLLGLTAALLCGQAKAAEPELAHYRVTRSAVDAFDVSIQVQIPSSDLSLNYFPTKDRPQGQSESIRNLRAYDARRRPLLVRYAGEGHWHVDGQAKYFSYTVRADHDAIRWPYGKDEVATHFDNSFFFVGDAFFLTDDKWPRQPVDVSFDLPNGWAVTAPWPGTGLHFTPTSPGQLVSNTFAMGTDKPQTIRSGDFQVQLLAAHALEPIRSKLVSMFQCLPAKYESFWGGAPARKFTIIAFPDTETDGGAFRQSFALRVATPFQPADSIVWPHLLSHELMHLWNGSGRIRGTQDGSIEWFKEGFTDYLAIKQMYACGIIDRSLFQQRLANFVRRAAIGRRLAPKLSISAAGADKGHHWELIYGGGALAAFVLDAEFSRQNPTGFRDALRRVYAAADEPFTNQRLLSELDSATGGRATQIVRWVDQAPDYVAIRERLGKSGISMSSFGSDEVYIDLSNSSLGVSSP
jgi:predicted metalloprotease with PDZ domain